VDAAWKAVRTTRWHARRSVRLALAAGILGGLAAIIPYPLYVRSECVIVASNRAIVHAEIDGVIAKVEVAEGALVHAGDLLVRLADHQALVRHQALSGALAGLDAQLAVAAPGARGLAATIHREQVAAARVERGRVALELAEVELELRERLELRAPIAGVVVTPKLGERAGEAVKAGDAVVEVADMARVKAEIFVEERELDAVKLGMPVAVKVGSYPRRSFSGRVELIAPSVMTKDHAGRIKLTAELDNAERLLIANMTGYGEVDCGSRSILNLMTRRLLSWIRVRYLF
jgi:multidrug resistance efflux pump